MPTVEVQIKTPTTQSQSKARLHAFSPDSKVPKMKIAIVEPVGGHAGMNFYNCALARGLAKAGAEVKLFTSSTKADASCEGFEIINSFDGVFGKSAKILRAARFLITLFIVAIKCRKANISLVHLHFFHYSILEYVTCVILQSSGLTLVATLHDVESFSDSTGPNYYKKIFGRVSHFIVHNQFSLTTLSKLLDEKTIKENVSVISSGNYLHTVKVLDTTIAKRTLDLPIDHPVILFFGQIKNVKGLDLLIEGFSKYKHNGGNGSLVIAGREWKDSFSKYEEKIQQFGIKDDTFTEIRYITDEEIHLFYSASDVIVLPYRRIYQSAVLIMAMSYGKAVIVPDLPAMLELVADGETGFVFETGNTTALARAIQSALGDPTNLSRVAANAYDKVKIELDWDVIGRATFETYKFAAASKRSAR